MIYRTLNEIRTIDPSLRTLKFNRSLREAGWRGQRMEGESDENGGAIAVILLAVVVALIVGGVWLTR